MNKYLKDIISGFLAGFFIGLGGTAFVMCKATLDVNGGLIGAMCFPIGLFMVCAFGVNLYTGKIGYAFNKEANTFNPLDFVIMLLANFLGAATIGFIVYLGARENQHLLDTAAAVAESRTITNPLDMLGSFFKSMVCGMLVYVGVYLYKKCNNFFERAVVIFIPIFLFVFCGFNHCIADFFYITFGMNVNILSLSFILIVVLGNSLGAILFDRALYLLSKVSKTKEVDN